MHTNKKVRETHLADLINKYSMLSCEEAWRYWSGGEEKQGKGMQKEARVTLLPVHKPQDSTTSLDLDSTTVYSL